MPEPQLADWASESREDRMISTRRTTLKAGGAGLTLVCLLPSVARAHAFVGDAGPAAGFMHPLTGPDHLLAMFAVGVLSVQIGGRAVWAVPCAFVTVMVLGGAAGAFGVPFPGNELGVAASVVVLGASIAFGEHVPLWAALVAAAAFGICHGFAHGREMPRAASPALYALGFAVSTSGLHVMGALTGELVRCRARGAAHLRCAGALVSITGFVFVAQAVERWPELARVPG